MRLRNICLAGLLAIPGLDPALSQVPELPLQRTATAPLIDGGLDDACWKNAAPISGFTQRDPHEGAPASERTEVRLCHDGRELYIAFRCFDREPDKINHTLMQRDAGLGPDDHVSVMLDPYLRGRDGHFFQVNANGAKVDGTTDTLRDWDALWRAAARIDEQGWTAELAIPFRSLAFDPDLDSWGINFSRFIPRRRELARWQAAYRNRGTLDLEDAGRLTGLKGLQRGLGLDIKPYVLARWQRDRSLPGDESDFETGGELFYRLTPKLSALLTVNTDFAETEVDRRQVNLTRFPLFFPEKRDFFLEDAAVFEMQAGGMRPFHSRTIGLSGTGDILDINGGGKLTGRVGKLGIGLLGVQLDSFNELERDEVFVGRLTWDLLKESRAGVLFTHGDPQGNGSNRIGGIDLEFKNSHVFGDGVLQANLRGLVSQDAGRQGEHAGFSVNLHDDPWLLLLEAEQTSEAFRPALGFLPRDGRAYRAFARTRWYANKEWLYFVQFGSNENLQTRVDGDVESESLEPAQFTLENLRGDSIFFTPGFKREVLFEDFEIRDGVVIPEGSYRFKTARFAVRSSASRPVSAGVNAELGEFFDGDRARWTGDLSWRPSRFYQFETGATHNDVDLPSGSFDSVVAFMNHRITPNPRWSWNMVLQWDNESDELGVQGRLRFILRPGQDLYFVVNQGYQVEDRRWRSEETLAVAKAGLTIRF